MMRAEVVGNAIEVTLSRSDAILLAMSAALALLLAFAAGWPVAVVAAGLSLLGAVAVDSVQRSEIRILGR